MTEWMLHIHAWCTMHIGNTSCAINSPATSYTSQICFHLFVNMFLLIKLDMLITNENRVKYSRMCCYLFSPYNCKHGVTFDPFLCCVPAHMKLMKFNRWLAADSWHIEWCQWMSVNSRWSNISICCIHINSSCNGTWDYLTTSSRNACQGNQA